MEPSGIAVRRGPEPTGGSAASPPGRKPRLTAMLGPAFVAAVAYVDPGNVAANITAGAKYGFLLLWVLVAANAMAVLVQYLSAKLALVSGRSLSELLGLRMGSHGRRAFWAQAAIGAIATDVAEVIGGAIALHLLFGLPLVWGGLVTGVVSMALLSLQNRRGPRHFEFVVMGMLAIIAIGFAGGLLFVDLSPAEVLGGLVPRFENSETLLLAAGMLGATVMPHAIYLHSALARDRHGHPAKGPALRRLLTATKWDVGIALVIAGSVNIALLVLAGAALYGQSGTDTIEGAHAAIAATLGPAIGVVFAVGLLASGLASTSVGSAAGAEIMHGLLKVRIPLLARRTITLAPAIGVLALGAEPTHALIISQVVLSFCIPFALVPLVRLTSDRDVMGEYRNSLPVRIAGWLTTVVIAALNVALIVLTFTGL